MEILPPKKIKIADIPEKGRGVIATEDILAGEIIECCPIIPLSEKEVSFLSRDSDILKFYYLFQYAIEKYCLMLGYGSLYNHSTDANVDIDYDSKVPKNFLWFTATKNIAAGQEIVYDYEFDDNKEDFLLLP